MTNSTRAPAVLIEIDTISQQKKKLNPGGWCRNSNTSSNFFPLNFDEPCFCEFHGILT